MTETEQQISQLREQVTQAQQEQARAEVARDEARKEAEATLRTLQEEFGVSSVEEARALEDRLEADLSSEVARVRGLLEEAGKEPG